MKKFLVSLALAASLMVSACSRVEPNQVGVLMEHYGKNGKEDFSLVSGRVITAAPGTQLYRIPLYEQRGKFEQTVVLKSADGTEFVVRPTYSYKVIRAKAVDVIMDNKQIFSDDGNMTSIQENILNPKIIDLLRSAVEKRTTTELMESGGNANFNTVSREIVLKEFENRGFQLISFSAMLDYSSKVKSIIDERNQSETQVATLTSRVEQARKQLELEQIETQIKQERTRGLSTQILQQQFIEKWDGETPLYGNTPVSVLVGKL